MRSRLLGSLAVAATLATATSAPAGFGGYSIEVTQNGLSPSSARLRAYSTLPTWVNTDSIERKISFLDGRCTMTIPPGGRAGCMAASLYAGTYRYHVSGRDELGEVVVEPAERSVTLTASRSELRVGQTVVLGGTLRVAGIAVAPPYAQTITVLRRVAGSRRFKPIGRVLCLPRTCRGYAWRLPIAPTETATYVARVVDPREKVVWKDAESARVTVRVTPSR